MLLVAALGAARFRRAGVAFAAAIAVTFFIAPLRGVGERAEVLDPLRGARESILLPLVAAVPGDAGALAAGLTLGDSRYFTSEFRSAMRESSTTHLVALSGFNVAIMLGLVSRLLRRRLSRPQVALAGSAFLLAFLLLAGFQPSLVRASIAGAAFLAADALGRRLGHARLLVLTAALMLLLWPGFVTHLGFVLSFISSWALVATVGDVEKLFISGSVGLKRIAASSVVPSIVAQLGVAPALLASVGSVMLVGLIVNPVVVPVTPLLTALSGVQLAIAHAAPPLGAVTGVLFSAATWPVLFSIRTASLAPLAVSFALPASLAAVAYAAWFVAATRRKPELW